MPNNVLYWCAIVCIDGVSYIGGAYCGTPGSPDVDGYCQQGYYCEYGSDTATPTTAPHKGVGDECPVGHHCPTGSPRPVPCPAGQFAFVTGKKHQADD